MLADAVPQLPPGLPRVRHAVEHGALSGDNLASRVAMVTAILATVGAVVGYQGGATQNEAMLFKNEAVLKKTEASNQWAYYQAKSIKNEMAANTINLLLAMEKPVPPDMAERKSSLEKDKASIKLQAEELEKDSEAQS